MNTNEQTFYRLLNVGETIKRTDERYFNGEWELTPRLDVNDVIQSNFIPFRRRILTPTDSPTLIPFDLEKAKAGAKLVTREGETDVEYLTDKMSQPGNVGVRFRDSFLRYKTNGSYCSDDTQTPQDLFIQE